MVRLGSMSASSFSARRARVQAALGDDVLVIASTPVALRNNDVEHDYRQDSDLYYLTGFDEPQTVLVLRGGRAPQFVLFVRPRDPEREVWDGAREGVEGALANYGADQAFPAAQLEATLPELLGDAPRLHYRLGRDRAFDELVLRALDRVRARARTGVSAPGAIVDPGLIVHELRLYKQPEELEAMRRALAITGEAHLEAMRQTQPGMYEYEVEALVNGTFRRRGAERLAYSSIVGGGPNATVLHYRRNDRQLQAGELLLIDAGCEAGYYASDITRTFPVSGRFSEPQRQLYDLVLQAQLASIAAAIPGATLDEVHAASVNVLAQGLRELGFFQESLEEVLERQLYRPYYMHRTSHWLGMDVHDVGAYFVAGKPRPLAPGMVLTVEPGLYVSETAPCPERYRGLGIRIEDDVLVTVGAAEVLSQFIPKTVAEVERACTA